MRKEPEEKMHFYDYIRALCEEKNISIRKMERDLGFSNASICKWNDRSPSIIRLKKVADYLGLTVDDMIKEVAHAED